MRAALIFVLLAAFGMLLLGCDAGKTAQNLSGLHVTSIEEIYAPDIACQKVKDNFSSDDLGSGDTYHTIVCMENHRFGRKLLWACGHDPGSVEKQYWSYNPLDHQVGYITCPLLAKMLKAAR